MSTELREAQIEYAMRKLEEEHVTQRESLYEFVKYYWANEKKEQLDENRHLKEICDRLEDIFYGRTKRLMINVPPRTLKTQIVSIAFPARCM